jgi:hypothetical protein
MSIKRKNLIAIICETIGDFLSEGDVNIDYDGKEKTMSVSTSRQDEKLKITINQKK